MTQSLPFLPPFHPPIYSFSATDLERPIAHGQAVQCLDDRRGLVRGTTKRGREGEEEIAKEKAQVQNLRRVRREEGGVEGGGKKGRRGRRGGDPTPGFVSTAHRVHKTIKSGGKERADESNLEKYGEKSGPDLGLGAHRHETKTLADGGSLLTNHVGRHNLTRAGG